MNSTGEIHDLKKGGTGDLVDFGAYLGQLRVLFKKFAKMGGGVGWIHH